MKKIVRLWMLLVLALTLGLAISVTASADAPAIGGKSQWKVGDIITLEKIERVSTVYAGEIFVDGESKMTWLYSTDLSNSEIVFQRLRECLSQTAFDGLVPAMTGETAAKGLAVSSDHQSEMGSGWKSAAIVAGQYFTGTVGSEKSGNFYDENAVYKTAVDAHYAERKETYDTPLGFNKTIGSALSTSTDFVWENHDGVLTKKYTVTAKVEETTVIYTTVNVTTEPQSANVKTAPTANTLTYTGSAQELVTAGEATGGTMHYALGTNAATVPTTGWSTSVPTATDAGTYYVWYMAKGDRDHLNSDPAGPVTVQIAKKDITVSGITAKDKVYDGTTAATLDTSAAVLTGKVGSDQLTVTATGTFADANAGENKTVALSGLTLGGTSAGNYQLATSGQQTSATASILKADSTVTTAPTGIAGLIANGTAQQLVNAGAGEGGTMQYAIGANESTAPDTGWSADLPTGTDAGTYYVWYKAAGDANHNDTIPACVTVIINEPEPTPGEKIQITGAKLTKIPNQPYTGKAIQPKLTLTYGGQKLVKGTDYQVAFSNNKKIGKATVTITGIGDYTGSRIATFQIVPKTMKLSSVKTGSKQLTVSWKKDKNVDGYQIEYSLKKNFKGSKKVTIKKAKTTQTVLRKLTANRKYYIRIRSFKKVKGKTYYSEWSRAKTAKPKK